jgi:hypothetical protein
LDVVQVAMVLSETGSTVRILRLAQKFRNFERSITVWRSVCGILHQVQSPETSESGALGAVVSSLSEELGFV